jgi:hypothetical protein
VHVHLYHQGAICRREGYVDEVERDVDALLDRLSGQ